MDIRFANLNYLAYLRQFDPCVPEKNRPWLWPVMIGGIPYGIPLTSQPFAAGDAGYLRCAAVPGTGLNLRFMVPMPKEALRPAEPLGKDLRKQMKFFEEAKDYIIEEAAVLRRLSENGKMNHYFTNLSCDYTELESVYKNWEPGYEAGIFLSKKTEDKEMPVSKKGTLYYTKAQYEAAKYNSSALEYARSHGYELVQQGSYYTMKEHDSMVFTPQGNWFWNSRGVHGSALEFMMYYEGRTLPESVLTLAGEVERQESRPAVQQAVHTPAPKLEPVKAAFRLPNKSREFRLLYGYLCGARGVDKLVVKEMIQQGKLYQSEYTRADGRVLSNVTFVYQDPEGKAVGAFQRGTYDIPGKAPYKRDVPGSDKQYGWQLSGEGQITEIRVFEGAIDAASDASLSAMKTPATWNYGVDRLSLEGLNFQPLQNYLQNHPEVRQVTLMLDGDEPGRKAAQRFAETLREKGYDVEDRVPLMGKDWNEVLVTTRNTEKEQEQQREAAEQEQTPEWQPEPEMEMER